MGGSLRLALYLGVAEHWSGFAHRKLNRRLAAGKEDPDRVQERRGIASVERPKGALIWFHAASVGESLSLLDLIERLLDDDPGLHVLITTGTRRSAALMSKRLPARAIHQFAPLDTRPFVRRFLNHWRPDIAVWTESELWPAMIHETHAAGTDMVLVNARMSDVSYRWWRWLRGIAGSLLNRFHTIYTQDALSRDRLSRLGADPSKLFVNGALKQCGTALPHNEIDRVSLAQRLQTRPVWLAALTHPGEETIAAYAHRKARRSAHRLMLIIAPHRPDRGPELAKHLIQEGWHVQLRSEGQEPNHDTDIYIADTQDEMGLWYRLAPISFVGGSMVPFGGHNPFEPAALGSAILHGPHIDNAQESYERLQDSGGSRRVHNTDELAEAVIDLLEPHKTAAMAHAAWEISSSGMEATDNAVDLLEHLLDERSA